MKKLLITASLLLTGCATAPASHAPGQDTVQTECRQLFQRVDTAVSRADVRDHGPRRIAGFPYLRVNRFYASFRNEVEDPARFSTWVRHLAALDARARGFELQNLPAATARQLGDNLPARLNRCRDLLFKADLAQPGQQARLRRAARVPDDYLDGKRLLGLYPISALFVSSGISRWHAEARRTFATPLQKLPVQGRLQRWAAPAATPLSAAGVRHILQQSRDALGIPQPDAAARAHLFATFAPIWEVDVADANDRIGTPAWRHGRLVVDTTRPAVFRKLSHTRFHGQVLLQLNYIIWFPARASDDIYGGRFDGIDFRVTLGPDGTPWMDDAIHNCGCYHEFFPSRHLRLKQKLPHLYFEPPLVPQQAPADSPLVLRIAHQTHYIERLYRAKRSLSAQPMVWRDYALLRALPDGNGHRSMFGTHGIVPGSERPERFLLWPTGVRSPGAMRQWGRHDTAFIGRRHFDDPDLIESLFETTGR